MAPTALIDAPPSADMGGGIGKRRLVFIFLSAFAVLAGTAHFLATSPRLALPVRLKVEGLSGQAQRDLALLVADEAGGIKLGGRTGCFLYCDGFWVREMALRLPKRELANVRSVTVTIGEASHSFASAEVLAWPRQTDHATDVALIVAVPRQFTSLPFWRGKVESRLNWPGDWAFVGALGKHSIVPLALVLTLAFWLRRMSAARGRRWSLQVLGLRPQAELCSADNAGSSTGALWNWIGLLFLVGALALLEIMEPYYFTQGDTVVESFPMILAGCRDVWRGEIPEYDPYLLFGQPLLSTGMYALTYPPLYLAYAISRHLLQWEYLTIEVFALMHLLAGFLAMRWLGRSLGVSALPANLMAASWTLSGASLIIGRSWFNFIPLVVWTPLLFLGLVHLLKAGRVGWGWIVGMGAALAMPFHVGFAQPAMYLDGFFCLAVLYLVVGGGLPWRQVGAIGAALLLGAGLSLPLVYQQWLLARTTTRFPVSQDGIAEGLPCCLLPYPLVQGRAATGWGNEHVELMGHLYFFGGLFAFLLLLQATGLAAWLLSRRETSEVSKTSEVSTPWWQGQMWTFLALIALWFSLGDAGGLWNIVSSLPVIGIINRTALRVLPFIVFFACLAGGLLAERLLCWAPNRRRIEMLVGVPSLLLLLLHVANCRTSFHHVHYRPYPSLPEFMESRFRKNGQLTGRVSNWGPFSRNETFGLILAQNTAAVHGLPTIHGINPLLEGTPAALAVKQRILTRPLQALRAYGARWFLTQSADRLTEVGSNMTTSWRIDAGAKDDLFGDALTLGNMHWIHEEDGVILRELPGCDPLAFAVDSAKTRLPLTLRGSGVDVDVSSLTTDQQVVVNFLHYPEDVMHGSVDGAGTPLHGDSWNRITARVPAGSKLLSIRYAPAWRTGIIGGLVVVGLGLLLGLVCLGKKR